ncbi:MAG: hypothetical protein V4723_11645 [Pseudomonadota bacterium]
MTFHRLGLAGISLVLIHAFNPAGATVSSVYTDVACKPSRPVAKKPAKKGAKVRLPAAPLACPTVAGFRLQVVQQHGRSSVNIIAPDRRIFPLNYWDVVSVGGRAEWRVVSTDGKTVPIGLIVPVKSVNAADNKRGALQPVLAVAKIGKHTACLVKKIDVHAPGAQEDARQHADGLDEICLRRPLAQAAP